MLGSYIRWVTSHAILVLVAVVVSTGLLAWQVSTLEVEVNPDSQLPQGHRYIQGLNRLSEVFGEKNLVFVGLFPKSGDVYTPRFLRKLDEVTQEIAELPGLVERTFVSLTHRKAVDIRSTPGGMEVEPFVAEMPETRDEALRIRDRVLEAETILGTLVARDGSAAGIVADFEFTPELPGYPQIREAIERVLRETNDGSFEARLGGPAIYVSWLAHYSERMFLFFPLALLVIGLVHYEAFRTLQAVVLPLTTAVLAMLWSLGLLGLLNVTLDPFNVTTPILILAVAAGHAVQLLKRFYEETPGRDVRSAVQRSMERVGPVMLTAGLVAVLSFLSLTTFETTAIRNFGLFTAMGILSSLVIEMTLIPAVRTLLPVPSRRERVRERGRHVFDAVTEQIARTLRRGGSGRILALAGVVVVVSAVGASRIVVDSSFRRQFSEGSRVRVDDRKLNAAFGGTNTLILLIEGEDEGSIDDPELLRAIDSLEQWFRKQPHVGDTLSYVGPIKRMHAAVTAGESRAGRLPASREAVAQYLLLYSFGGSFQDFDRFVDPTHRITAVRVYVKEDSTRYAEQLIDRLQPKLETTLPPGYEAQVTGSLASAYAMNEIMVRGKVLNVLQIAAIILIVASAVFRSFVGGLLVATPLAFAVLTNFGIMGLVGIPLDIGTSAISAMAVGIGADYAIYFLFRLREELPSAPGLVDALDRTLRTSGKAILFVSSAIAAGYLTLCFSGFGYHIRLGTLVALAMVVSSLASLTVLPSIVLAVRPRFLLGPGTARIRGRDVLEGRLWKSPSE